jgi:hypothetical protein
LTPLDESIIIPLTFGGKEREFEARLQSWAYGHRIFVDVDGVELIIERDDGGIYRALVSPEHSGPLPSAGLVQAIIETLQAL